MVADAVSLEHVIGDDVTLAEDRGVFLTTTWRMHPDVCNFISDQIYEGRLTYHPNCERQTNSAERDCVGLRQSTRTIQPPRPKRPNSSPSG